MNQSKSISDLAVPQVIDPNQVFSQAPTEVRQAVQQASARTGVDFSYLMHKAKAESSFNPDAAAKTSSAKGLYQFIDQTWLSMVKRHGADYGLGKEAAAIEQGSDGRFRITDPAQRDAIMDLRFDPTAAANMAAEFAGENRDYLVGKLGHEVGATELYFAHFLGAGGAGKFLTAMEQNPNAEAAALMPKAAAANRNVFYDRGTGEARSLAEVYDFFAAKFEGAEAISVASRDVGTGHSWSSNRPVSEWSPHRSTNLDAGDPIIRRLIETLRNSNADFSSVADVVGSNQTIGQGLLANDLMLLVQQAI
ncbi:MAG: transglycosylase SLT domain-containing protein [Alphaproteobacteria bacterium]|nr:transglycosylase SLT domain-containing protein [Alphaproteobacteria bacterium SS10]